MRFWIWGNEGTQRLKGKVSFPHLFKLYYLRRHDTIWLYAADQIYLFILRKLIFNSLDINIHYKEGLKKIVIAGWIVFYGFRVN